MAAPVILTPVAQEDLRRIVEHASQDSRERALALGNRLIDRALAAGAFPQAGRIMPEERDPAVRQLIEENYRIIYEYFPDQPSVYILRFWHAARGVPDIRQA